MFPFKSSLSLASKSSVINTKSKSVKQAFRQHLASRASSRELPTIPTCPSPTCECAEMPPGLDIDEKRNLNGTMAAYSEHIVVSTGQADWKSRIEDEKESGPWGEVVSNMKGLLGPKGRLHDPYRNVVISTSSFHAAPGRPPSALIFPSFSYVSAIPPSRSEVATFLNSHVLANQARPSEQNDSKRSIAHLLREKSQQTGALTPISTPTILICSHNSRDSRCGVMGPLLHQEFVQYINKRQALRNKVISDVAYNPQDTTNSESRSFASHPEFRSDLLDPGHGNQQPINVGMISHIGGHKWAGNVIVYIPPGYQVNSLARNHHGAQSKDRAADEPVVHEEEALSKLDDTLFLSPLAGKGIWYGRVQPKHVEGIVEQTIGRGTIIEDLFRGGLNHNGTTLRL